MTAWGEIRARALGTARVLSVRQPWAWSIIFGGKDVENRTRSLGPYTGPVLIHAGLTPVDDDDEIWNAHRYRQAIDTAPADARRLLDARGVILGVVDLVATHRTRVTDRRIHCETVPAPSDPGASGACSSWADPGVHHLELRNPRALVEPVKWRGGLGLRRSQLDVVGDRLVENGLITLGTFEVAA